MHLIWPVVLLKDGRLTLRLGNCGQLTQLLLSQFDAMNSGSAAAGVGKHHQRAFVSPSALFNDICSRSQLHMHSLILTIESTLSSLSQNMCSFKLHLNVVTALLTILLFSHIFPQLMD